MAEAATIPTTTPKQLGKQLRAVRRRKGLSLSEVARGAGLSRRELVAYERGKVPIPESDLWVLAGSCGVDVSELTPEHGALELEAGPESIGDTIAFLRRGQQNGAGGRAVLALEAADEPTPSYSGPQAPAPPAPSFAVPMVAAEPTTAAPVDVFEELARLPEPVPLNNDPDDYPDMLAPPAFLTADARVESAQLESAMVDSAPFQAAMVDSGIAPPDGTFELVDEQPFVVPTAASVADLQVPEYAGFDAPLVVDAAPDTLERPWTPADAPPIDVAHRGETFASPAWTTDWQPDASPTWDTPDWETATSGVWNEPDTASGAPDWSSDAPVDDASGERTALASYEDVRDLPPAQVAAPADHSEWAHEPDPEATSTGFLVDWGDPDAPPAPRTEWRTRGTFEALEEIPASDPVDTHDDLNTYDDVNSYDEVVTVDDPPRWEPTEPLSRPEERVTPDEDDGLAPISWHPEESTIERAASIAPVPSLTEVELHAAPSSDEWIAAGDEWELGNALPLVEVRGQGALVMRRADERWALADLTVSDRYLVEVDLDFRAGPGFGVLFRADVDDEGRMSAYSFDVDPVYEGGGYLVRQWHADRELWNPIAHVSAADPGAMYGDLTVRLEVVNERLIASVNDTVVMTVDDLQQGSVERGRLAPTGQRVGVQAWSSSDLVIETLRIADR